MKIPKIYLVRTTLNAGLSLLSLVFSLTVFSQGLTDQQLIDKINEQPPLSSGQLKNILIANSPLSDTVLLAMLARNPSLTNGHIEEALTANSPLSDAVLIAMLNMSNQLSNGTLTNILINEAPLSQVVLVETSNLANPLPTGNLQTIVQQNTASGFPFSAAANATNISCFGANDGSIDLVPTGGMPPYTFNWNTGAITEDLGNLAPGTYSVTVTDFLKDTATASATITQPALLTASTVKTDNLCQGESKGSIDLTVQGGTTPYSFLWSNDSTTEDISGLAAGNYAVTVTDAHGCTATAADTITEPSAIFISSAITHVSCFGFSDGSVNITVSGGTSPYSFLWSTADTTEDISGLVAGSYSFTVTDANGCSKKQTYTITQPAALSVFHFVVNTSCIGGSDGAILLTVHGGTTPYQFNWSNGATTKDAEQLTTGTYSVTVTDAHNCSFTIQDSVGIQNGDTSGICLHNQEIFVKITSGISLKVFGTMDNDSGFFDNSGTVSITKDFINNSDNGGFSTQNGEVILAGDSDQAIKGNRKADMHHLTLGGGGVKRLTNHLDIYGTLNLQDRELVAGSRTLTIKNTNPAAVVKSIGFVSNTEDGSFIREMTAAEPYLFPVGSSIGTTRYRPVEIIPVNTNSQKFSVRFVNHNPGDDGYDPAMRKAGIAAINNAYYHRVKRVSGIDTIGLNLYFDRSADGAFNSGAQWLYAESKWQSINGDTTTVSPLVKLTVPSASGLDSAVFALSKTAVFRIITEDLDVVNYEVSGAGLTGTFRSGGVETFIPEVPLSGDTTITINISAGADNDSLKIIFEIDSLANLSNVRALIPDSAGTDTFSLDSSFHKIIESRNLHFINGDSLVIGNSAFAGSFVLENGLLLSPNNDDSYDELVVTGLESINTYELNIKDLSDNLVFTTTNKQVFWNGLFMNTGSLVAKGVYKYDMQLDSKTVSGQLLVNY